MKKVYIALISLFAASSSIAQVSIGIQGGSTHSHTDATPSKGRAGFGVHAQYTAARYFSLRANLNAGQLKGGELSEKTLMSYSNNFIQADLGFRFYPLGLINSKENSSLSYLSKIYGGLGVGLLKNNTKINQLAPQSFSFIQDYKGTDLVIPAEFGIEMPLGKMSADPKFNLNLYYRFYFLNTDKMDGYVPNLSSNKSNDAFSSVGIGISYKIGGKKAKKGDIDEIPKFED